MKGLGTVINVLAIIAGGVVGLFFSSHLKERYQNALISITGVAVMFLGIEGAVSHMELSSMMMICSLALGSIIGEAIDIDGGIERFGEYLKKKSGSEGDRGFVGAFVSASCTVCIGAMAIMGSIEDGIYGNYSILLAKAILDAIIICIMAASSGKGAVFSAIPVGLFQGSITLVAMFAGSFMSEAALANISYVGSILIFLVGLNMIRDKRISVANALPAIVVAALWSLL